MRAEDEEEVGGVTALVLGEDHQRCHPGARAARTRNLEIPGLRQEAHPGMTTSHSTKA